MSTETVNILALVLGFLGIVVAGLGMWVTFIISKRTDKLIQSEDEKAKALIKETQRMIDKGDERLETMLKETQRMIDEGKREIQRLIEEGNARIERFIDEGRRETRELISYMVKILEGMEKRAEERHKELLMR